MDLKEFLDYLDSGKRVTGGSEIHQYMGYLSQEAIKITTELNSHYHTPEEVVELFEKLIGRKVPKSFRQFPPFTTDCGKNIHIGENVFINSGCRFQDQGGIYIGNDVLIGHNVIIATLNHEMDPEHRADMYPKSVIIKDRVWIGSGSVILPGVTIGEGAVIGAASTVTHDIPERAVAVGSPAKVVRYIE